MLESIPNSKPTRRNEKPDKLNHGRFISEHHSATPHSNLAIMPEGPVSVLSSNITKARCNEQRENKNIATKARCNEQRGNKNM